jgi:hypothetical protein
LSPIKKAKGGKVESTPTLKKLLYAVFSASDDNGVDLEFEIFILLHPSIKKDKIMEINTNTTTAVFIITNLFLLIVFKFINLILLPFYL